MCQNDFAERSPDFYDQELEFQAVYDSQINVQLNKFKDFLTDQSTDKSLAELAVQMRLNETRPPPLECGTFSGMEKDKFAFNTFINQFNTVIGNKEFVQCQ